MPEIAKFEQKVIDFKYDIEKCNLIIRKFDEDLTHKIDKTALNVLQAYCDDRFELKGAKTAFIASQL